MDNENIMSAEEFFGAFKKCVTKKMDLVQKRYGDRTSWTSMLKDIMLEVVGASNVSFEYYRLDMLKYRYTDFYNDYEANKKHKNTFDNGKFLWVYNWENIYAIEYENDRHSWTDELVKLSHLRCKLKVLVCYSEYGNTKNADDDKQYYHDLIEKKMEFATEVVKGSEAAALDDEWLILIGPATGEYRYKDVHDHFVGYKMVDKKFQKITL